MSVVRYRVVVSGWVQGVWFRQSCRDQARRLGATGWVRNREDGRVEIEVEGEEAVVAQVVSWCRAGPPQSRVSGVELTELSLEGDTTFRVVP